MSETGTRTAAVAVEVLPPAARWSIRTADPVALSAALPVALPAGIGAMAWAGDVLALCLGPDEWLLSAPESLRESVDGAEADVPHSIVDTSDRDLVIAIGGKGAVEALLAGCPRDIERFPVGRCARTVFDGVAVILVRHAEDHFALHVARSFAPHVLFVLEAVRKELALGL